MSNIILKDKSGTDIEYSEKKWLGVPDTNGEIQYFAKGTPTTKEIELDFTDGHMIVPADNNTVMTEITINRPKKLIPANIVDGVKIAGIEGKAAVLKEGSALVYSKVKYFNYYPTSNTQYTELVSSGELSACGIDLAQYNQWYKDGHVYVPFVRLTKLMDADKTYPTSYRCISDAWISNIKRTPRSGSLYCNGSVKYNNESGKDYMSDMYQYRKSSGLPFTSEYTSANTSSFFNLRSNGSLYVQPYYSSSVRYMLHGYYCITVMLIPTS